MGKFRITGLAAACVCAALVAGMAGPGTAEHQAATIQQAAPPEVAALQPLVIENVGAQAKGRQDILDCPPGSLYSQPVDTGPTAYAFASDYRIGQKMYDNFWGVSESICDIHWWGLNADAATAECVKYPDRFEIVFYHDDGLGAPGPVACGPYIVTPTKVNAGTWGAYTLYYYSTVLVPCCNLASGWVSITGLDDLQDCYFWWVSSPAGDGTCWLEDLSGGTMTAEDFDLSFCLTGHCVPPGQDCWETSCSGGGTQADFSNGPIPADFFGPGSDPFDGVIALGGGPGMIDTILERKGWMCFPEPLPSTAQVELELISLDLVSCAPITVTYGGSAPEQWDVQVGLSGEQDPGMLNATKTHDDGGYFDANFSVQPLYTFTQVNPPYNSVVFDPRDHGIPPISMGTGGDAYWSTREDYEHCTMDGFAGGYATLPDKEECCPETCHDSYGEGHLHCAKPPECPECPECEALPDQSACKRVVCPDPIEECEPVRIQEPPPSPAPRAAGDPLPEGGTDEIYGTTGNIYVEAMPGNIYGFMPEVWYFEIQEGPPNETIVVRGDPVCDPLCLIDMEITTMNLVAYDGVFNMNVHLNPDPAMPSGGYAEEDELPSGDFPVDSFFDVYVEVDIPEIPTNILHNELPIPLEAPGIVDLPPWGEEYQVPAGWEGVQLYDGTIPTGLWIRWVFHGLPPPWWRIVDCECLEPDEVHVEYDAATGAVWCVGSCPPGYLPVLYAQPNPDGSTDYWCQCDCICGDINHSGGNVDLQDFGLFALCYGYSGPTGGCTADLFDCADMDGSGTVDLFDFGWFAGWYGLTSPQTVPNCPPP